MKEFHCYTCGRLMRAGGGYLDEFMPGDWLYCLEGHASQVPDYVPTNCEVTIPVPARSGVFAKIVDAIDNYWNDIVERSR